MGSTSDHHIMLKASEALKYFEVDHELKVVSAHRSPEYMQSFALNCHKNGLKIIIAGAGGAAHLPGMVASLTTLPVIGVPIGLKYLSGLDSLLSIVSMPSGVPVATVAIDGAYNAGLLAVKMLSINDQKLTKKLLVFAQKKDKDSRASKFNAKSIKNLK